MKIKQINGKVSVTNKQVEEENDETKTVQKQSIAEVFMKEMRTGGTASLNAEHKRKPFLSYFIHKKDEVMEAKRSKAFLPIDEFVELVHFKFGIPLIVLDFIDYVTGSDFI